MFPPNNGERWRPDRIISCVWALVLDIAQNNCGIARRRRIADMVQFSLSDGWVSNFDQSIVRPSRRGGVPVLRRAIGRSAPRNCSERSKAESSPTRPPSSRSSPRNSFPPRNVPVARITADDVMVVPSPRINPATRVGAFGVKCKAAASA